MANHIVIHAFIVGNVFCMNFQLIYALTVTHKLATYALTRYRLLLHWCMRSRLWVFPSDQRAVNWDRSHTLHNTIISIGNLVGTYYLFTSSIYQHHCQF